METTTRNSNLPAIAFALAALTATFASPAVASGEPRTESVRYGDLNLASPAGIDVLDRRLDRAVRRVCGTATITDLSSQRQIDKCRQETWQSIEDDRQVAIAKATGQHNVQRAEGAPRGQTQVSLAE